MKIIVCDPVSPKGVALLQQRPEFQVVVLDKRLPEAELIPLVADAAALVRPLHVPRPVLLWKPALTVPCPHRTRPPR